MALAIRHLGRAPSSSEHGRGFVRPQGPFTSRGRGPAKGNRCSLPACFSNRQATVKHLLRLLGPL